MSYPKRNNYFAHRFARLLTKTALALDLGPEVCWMLTVVAMQEDSKRYRAPPTYWNDQLMALVGTKRAKTFRAWRDRAVEAGWLHYEYRGTKRPGVYWVTIPPEFGDLPDGPCDESDFVIWGESARDAGGLGAQTAPNSAPNSAPYPYPSPNPNPPPPTPSTTSPVRDRADHAADLAGAGEAFTWEAITEKLRGCGVTCPGKAVEVAQADGMTIEQAANLIAFWTAHKPKWQPGALVWRFTRGDWPTNGHPRAVDAGEISLSEYRRIQEQRRREREELLAAGRGTGHDPEGLGEWRPFLNIDMSE